MQIKQVDYKRRAELMRQLFDQCLAMAEAGQKEYAHGGDSLSNFRRLSVMLKLSPTHVLWVYLQKHLDGITGWITGHRSQREPVQGRIIDAIVYLAILWIMAENEEGPSVKIE